MFQMSYTQLLEYIKTPYLNLSETHTISFKEITDPEEFKNVLSELAESQLIVTISIGRPVKAYEVEYLSSLLLKSGANKKESSFEDSANDIQDQRFTIKNLDLSNSGFDDKCAYILARALQVEFNSKSYEYKSLSRSSTLEELNLSGNDLSYAGMSIILKALTDSSNSRALEYASASQTYFSDAEGIGLKPVCSIPIRAIDFSNNQQQMDSSFIYPEDAPPSKVFVRTLCEFIKKNWTLKDLGIAGINTGDWGKKEWREIFKAIEDHNKAITTPYGKIRSLDLQNSKLRTEYIEDFSPNTNKGFTIDISSNKDFIKVPKINNLTFILESGEQTWHHLPGDDVAGEAHSSSEESNGEEFNSTYNKYMGGLDFFEV